VLVSICACKHVFPFPSCHTQLPAYCLPVSIYDIKHLCPLRCCHTQPPACSVPVSSCVCF
jgi:hypothetical protein